MRSIVALLCLVATQAHAAENVAWTETIITSHADVDLSGDFVLAYNGGGSATTVDGVTYAVLPRSAWSDYLSGLTGYNLCIECTGDFNTLMDSMVYNTSNSVTQIHITGLTPGERYRVQMLMSNDLNTTGATERWLLSGVGYTLDGFALPERNETINLSVTFTATATTEDIYTSSGTVGTSETDRGIFNAILVRTAQPDTDGDGYYDDVDVCPGVFDDQTDTDGDGFGDACADVTANIDPSVVHFGSWIGARANVGANVDIGLGTVIARRADIGADSTIGSDVTIGRSATVGPLATLGNNVIIGYGADVAGSSLGDRTVVGNLVDLTANSTIGADCVLARSVSITGSATLEDNVIIGPETTLLDNVTIGAGARLRKEVDVRANVDIGAGSRIGRSVLLHDGSATGIDATVRANAVLQPDTCVPEDGFVPRGETFIEPCVP